MSSILCWKPSGFTPDGNSLSCDLKYRVAEKYFGHDGTLGYGEETFYEKDIPFFEALEKEGVEDADEMIELIRRYPAGVDLFLEV